MSFEVRHIENQADIFSVNLKDHECSCRKWQLTSLPCVHFIYALKSRNLNINEYISDFYKKSRYQVVYQPIIYSINGINLWIKIEYPNMQPPKFRKMTGRPKKRRNL